MSKRIWIILGFATVITAVGYQLYALSGFHNQKPESVNDQLPLFEFKKLDGEPYGVIDLPEDDRPVVLMYMDPTCKDCENLFRRIQKHYSEFANTTFLIVTESDTSQANAFHRKYKLENYPNIISLQDTNQTMFKHYSITSVPAVVVYDSKHNLVKKIDGDFTLSIVVKYVRAASKKSGIKIF